MKIELLNQEVLPPCPLCIHPLMASWLHPKHLRQSSSLVLPLMENTCFVCFAKISLGSAEPPLNRLDINFVACGRKDNLRVLWRTLRTAAFLKASVAQLVCLSRGLSLRCLCAATGPGV